MNVSSLSSVVLAAAAIVGVALFQDTKKPAAPAGAGMMAPQATAQHAHLKAQVGVWDAAIKMMMPGMPASESKGTETNTMLGDLWLVSDFKGDMMGAPFTGHGITGYDTAKNKFVGTWVDSMSTYISNGEGTADASGKVLTMTYDMQEPGGKMTKMRQTIESKDANTRVFTMYMAGPDGKEAPTMVITYTRKK